MKKSESTDNSQSDQESLDQFYQVTWTCPYCKYIVRGYAHHCPMAPELYIPYPPDYQAQILKRISEQLDQILSVLDDLVYEDEDTYNDG